MCSRTSSAVGRVAQAERIASRGERPSSASMACAARPSPSSRRPSTGPGHLVVAALACRPLCRRHGAPSPGGEPRVHGDVVRSLGDESLLDRLLGHPMLRRSRSRCRPRAWSRYQWVVSDVLRVLHDVSRRTDAPVLITSRLQPLDLADQVNPTDKRCQLVAVVCSGLRQWHVDGKERTGSTTKWTCPPCSPSVRAPRRR